MFDNRLIYKLQWTSHPFQFDLSKDDLEKATTYSPFTPDYTYFFTQLRIHIILFIYSVYSTLLYSYDRCQNLNDQVSDC